jgi:hypothetical protein
MDYHACSAPLGIIINNLKNVIRVAGGKKKEAEKLLEEANELQKTIEKNDKIYGNREDVQKLKKDKEEEIKREREKNEKEEKEKIIAKEKEKQLKEEEDRKRQEEEEKEKKAIEDELNVRMRENEKFQQTDREYTEYNGNIDELNDELSSLQEQEGILVEGIFAAEEEIQEYEKSVREFERSRSLSQSDKKKLEKTKEDLETIKCVIEELRKGKEEIQKQIKSKNAEVRSLQDKRDPVNLEIIILKAKERKNIKNARNRVTMVLPSNTINIEPLESLKNPKETNRIIDIAREYIENRKFPMPVGSGSGRHFPIDPRKPGNTGVYYNSPGAKGGGTNKNYNPRVPAAGPTRARRRGVKIGIGVGSTVAAGGALAYYGAEADNYPDLVPAWLRQGLSWTGAKLRLIFSRIGTKLNRREWGTENDSADKEDVGAAMAEKKEYSGFLSPPVQCRTAFARSLKLPVPSPEDLEIEEEEGREEEKHRERKEQKTGAR